eukprot:7722968-Lingulodinium_polyedra.AAC.1
MDTGMGIVCIFNGWSDPMYVNPDHESYVLTQRQKVEIMTEDRAMAKPTYAHIPTGPDSAEIRVGHSKTPGRSMDSPRMTRSGQDKTPPRVTSARFSAT